jgi:hypothetical protein
MATRSFTADDKTAAGVSPVDRRQAGPTTIHRHRLTVVGLSTADVVQSAGGWLCDRARAGWDVNVFLTDVFLTDVFLTDVFLTGVSATDVLVTDPCDQVSLTILGATTLRHDGDFSSLMRGISLGGALAVSADLLSSDSRVRSGVVNALKRGLTDVTVWGTQWPAELGRQADPVQHRVSLAARAFKLHALVAADLSTDAVTPTETLFRIRSGSFRPLYSV